MDVTTAFMFLLLLFTVSTKLNLARILQELKELKDKLAEQRNEK